MSYKTKREKKKKHNKPQGTQTTFDDNPPRWSKSGKTTNQKGAFGQPRHMR